MDPSRHRVCGEDYDRSVRRYDCRAHDRSREARVALKANPRLVEPLVTLIDIAEGEGGSRACAPVVAQALKVAPASYRIRSVPSSIV